MRRAVLIIILAVGLAAMAVAQTSQTPPSANATVLGTSNANAVIQGKVVRLDDGGALKNAVVTAFQGGGGIGMGFGGQGGRRQPQSVLSDAEGNFALKGLDAGTYTLTVTRNGYLRQAYGQRGPNTPGTSVTVAAGQTVNDIMFRMAKAGVISGRVVDEDGEALSGVRVQALRWVYRLGQRTLMPAGTAMSNDLGEYRLAQMSPGQYYISATYMGTFGMAINPTINVAGPATGGVPLEQIYPQTYYPDVTDAGDAAAVKVSGGEEVPGINFRLQPARAVHVRGTVRPVALRTFVQLLPLHGSSAGPGQTRGSQTDENGAFDIPGVPPGSYVLTGSTRDLQDSYWLRQPVEVGGADVQVSAQMQPDVTVSGHVQVEGNLTAASASATGGTAPRLYVSLVPNGNFGAGRGGGGGGTEVDAQSNFAISNVVGGEYTLSVSRPQDAYIKSERMGDRDVLTQGLTVQGPTAPIEIVISANGARIDGTVVDDHNQPFSGARIILVPEVSKQSRMDLYRTANSDQSGRFSLRGIAPGNYSLFAFERVDEGSWYDPDFLSIYSDYAQSVRVDESSQVTQQLKVIAASEN